MTASSRAASAVLIIALGGPLLAACTPPEELPPSADLDSVTGRSSNRGAASPGDTAAIGDTLRALIQRTYDFSQPNVVDRLMALYPDDGEIVSAAAGRVVTERDSIRAQIDWFWNWIGQNMQQPRWEWGETHVRVLSPNAAVLTAEYRIPHLTPDGRPHVVGGAWTAVFERRPAGWRIVHEHLSDIPAGG